MASKCVVTCAHCGQRLSVPSDRGALNVRCTRCEARWLWTPPPEFPEMVQLDFRCASTGSKFQVAFGRHHPNHRFRVVRVIFDPVVEKTVTVLPPSQSVSLVSRLLAPFRGEKNPQVESSRAARATTPQSFDASNFDFGGWYCPCCGYGQNQAVDPHFVQCGTCREFICGGRIARINGGGLTFECHDGCTGGGRIGSETIKKIDGAPVQTALPPGAPASAALPQRDRSVLPKSRKPTDPPLLE